jgi:hypothetical protein
MIDHTISKSSKRSKRDIESDKEMTNLRIKSAQNNMIYDAKYFCTELHLDLKRMKADSTYRSVWLLAFAAAKRENIIPQDFDLEAMVIGIVKAPIYECAVYRRKKIGPMLGKPVDGAPAVGYDHDLFGGLHQQREIHLDPDVRARLQMMHIRIRQNECVVCRQPTNEFIEDGCDSGCGYYCHDICAARWIVARFDNPQPYCMVCGVYHTLNQIPQVMSDQGFIDAARERVVDGLLDPNNLGQQFHDYLNYRGIGVNQIGLHAIGIHPIDLVMEEDDAND